MDKYTITARLYPAIITGLPIVIVGIPIINMFLQIAGANRWISSLLGNLSFSVIIVYFYSQVIRYLGKFIFEKILFRNDLHLPTTELLHPENEVFSKGMKITLYTQIKNDFSIDLKSYENDYELRRKINEAVTQIRIKVKKGHLVFQHNIEYGFVRNLCGGAIIGLFFSLLGLLLHFYDKNFYYVFIVLAIVYLIILLSSRYSIRTLGQQYAKVLITEYAGGASGA